MSKLFWVLGAVTLGVAAYVVMNQPLGQLATTDDVEDTASGIEGWGTRQRVVGTGGQLKGNLKQGAGDLLGNDKLKTEGAFDQAAGAVQDAAGKAAGAVANTVRKLSQ